MSTALVAAIASVLVVLISTLGTVLTSRNDRALALQEADLLAKLLQDGSSAEATEHLRETLRSRTWFWEDRTSAVGMARRAGFRSVATGTALLLLASGVLSTLDPGRSTAQWWALLIAGAGTIWGILGFSQLFLSLRHQRMPSSSRADDRSDRPSLVGVAPPAPTPAEPTADPSHPGAP